MAELPTIVTPRPSSVPAQPAKTYPHAFLTMLQIAASPNKPSPAVVVLRNYNRDTGELSPRAADISRLQIADIFAESQRVPILGQAMGAVIMAVNLLVQEKSLTDKIAVAQKNLAAANQSLVMAQAMPDGDEKTVAISAAQGQVSVFTEQLQQNQGALQVVHTQMGIA